MPWHVEFISEIGVICVTYSGRVTAEEFKAGTTATIAQMNKHGTHLLLIDDSRLEIAVSVSDIFEMPRFYERSRAHRTTRWALLEPPGGRALKDVKFFVNVCRNRGWQVERFIDRQAAIDWLLKDRAAEKPDADGN